MAQLGVVPDSRPVAAPTEVSISFEAGTTLIVLTGEIDLAVRAGLEFAAEEATRRTLPVRVDLSSVTFMDSAGVAFLATLVRAASEFGRRLTVIGPSRQIAETLTISGLVPALDLSIGACPGLAAEARTS